jgi:hypothetical protein
MRKGRHATSRKSKPGDLKDIQEEAPRSRTGNKKGTGEEEATLLGGSGRDDRTPRKKDKGTPRSLTTPASLSEVAPDTAHGANSANRSRTPSPTPRQLDEGGKHPSDHDTSPEVDTGISPSTGCRLPSLQGGSALSPTPTSGVLGRGHWARTEPRRRNPFGKASLPKKGPISKFRKDI